MAREVLSCTSAACSQTISKGKQILLLPFASGLVPPGGRVKDLWQHGLYLRLQKRKLSDEACQPRRLAQ
jgi:hypothetical protein